MLKKTLTMVTMLFSLACGATVEVNTATEAELDSIKGIGPSLSGKILAERKKGDFNDWKDFMARVKGVREANASKFSKEGLAVNGEAFKASAAKP